MAESEQPTTAPRDGRARLARALLVVLTAVILPALLVADVIVKSPELSVLDEPVHIDYLRRIEQGEVPRIGDLVELETVRDVQCRTVQGRVTAPCGLPLDRYYPDMLGAAGYSYEAQQPPLYYVVTAGLRQLARIGPADDFVTTARVTGAAWLSAGLLVFWLAARRLGLGWWTTAAAVTLLAVSPGVLYQTATVNNDAAAVLTGSLCVLMFAELRAKLTPGRVAAWSAVAVLIVLIKPTGVVAVAAAVGGLLLDALLDRRLSVRSAIGYASPVLAGVVTYGLWGLVRDARAVVDYEVVLDALLAFKQVDSFPFRDTLNSVTRLVKGYGGGAAIAPDFVRLQAELVVFVLVGGALGWLWKARGGEATDRLAAVALAVMLIAGPAYTALFYFDYSIRGGPSGRYGLSLLPLLAVGVAGLCRTRRSVVFLFVLAALVAVPLLVAVNYPTTRGS
jgi:hypothetical protein